MIADELTKLGKQWKAHHAQKRRLNKRTDKAIEDAYDAGMPPKEMASLLGWDSEDWWDTYVVENRHAMNQPVKFLNELEK